MTDHRPLVVVIHGFAANRLAMHLLARRFEHLGYRTLNWSYRSLSWPISTHAQRLGEDLSDLLAAGNQCHIVAHSMGSIITRVALCRLTRDLSGRVVLLAPPNRGLPLVNFAPPVMKRHLPPIDELSDRADSFVNSISDQPRFEIGVIAARFDLLIPVANTHLTTEQDHVTVRGTHNSLLFSRKVFNLAWQFLDSGRFFRDQ